MKRSFLTALGIEKDVIDQIMAEHGNTVEIIKEKASEDLAKQAEKLNVKITTLQEKIDNMPKTNPNEKDWKSKHEALQEKYDADIATKQKELDDYKTAVETEKNTVSKQSALRKQLEADGANPKLVGLLEKEFDLGKVEIKDGKIKGWDEISKSIKETYAEVFGTISTRGADVATPPLGQESKPQEHKDMNAFIRGKTE